MNPGPLDKIDHLVVLMLENRSFDNVLGWLYDSANAPPFQIPPGGQSFDGVSGKNLSNPVADGAETVPYARTEVLYEPSPDPGEEFAHVARQLNGGQMDGFVIDYIRNFQESENRAPSHAEYQVIMRGFGPDSLPVLGGLAAAYAVCDRWFASVPSQTLCNRCFCHCATSRGFVNNKPIPKWALTRSKTVFELLGEAGLPWRVYYDELDLVPLSRLSQPSLWTADDGNFQTMRSFFKDAASGELPAYSFIEPRFFLDHNDAHPPLDKRFLVTSSVAAAELLVHSVYEALSQGKNWEKTIFVITFDEHGGCFDHVRPPGAIAPELDAPAGEEGYRFDSLGVRVPAILVSPWIQAGTVDHTVYDHTSLIKTLSRRFGLGHLTQRDAQANDLSACLNLESPRADRPAPTPLPYTPSADHASAPLHSLQRYILELVAAYEAVRDIGHEGTFESKLKIAIELIESESLIGKLKTVGDATDYLAERLDPERGWFGGKNV